MKWKVEVDRMGMEVNRPRVQFTREGVFLRRECPRCGEVIAVFAPTVVGVPVGRHRCTRCGHHLSAEPEAILEAMEAESPAIETGRRKDASHASSQFRPSEALRSMLTYRGVALRNDDLALRMDARRDE